jgi:hypothetical protein
VWHLPSGTCLACCSYGGAQFERAVRQLCWLPRAAGTAGPALLIAAGEEGGLHFWEVQLPAALELPGRAATPEPCIGAASGSATAAAASDWAGLATCRLAACVGGAHRPQDCVTALCVDARTQQLWVGDSEGHVAAWDLTPLRSTAGSGVVAGQEEDSDTAAAALPTRGVLWRASDSPIVSLDVMAAPSAAAAAGTQEEKGLLLVGAQDAAISIWTQQVGRLGGYSEAAGCFKACRSPWPASCPAGILRYVWLCCRCCNAACGWWQPALACRHAGAPFQLASCRCYLPAA